MFTDKMLAESVDNSLSLTFEVCRTSIKNSPYEEQKNNENSLCLPGKHLPQPDG